MAGKLIRLFLTDGDADGVKTIEISNMTIKGTLFPRPSFSDFNSRPEAKRPGVYMIYGDNIKSGDTTLYIGEGDPVGPRLNSHYGKKDFWSNAIVFTSKDDYLTKTQIQYLEVKLITQAKRAGKVVLDNVNHPTEPNISEVDEAEVSVFLDSILLLLKSMGIDFFIPDVIDIIENSDASEIYTMKYRNAEARMIIEDGKYILLKGSNVVENETDSINGAIRKKRRSYLEKGILVKDSTGNLLLTENLEFNSDSYAGSIVSGASVNGMTTWKLNNKTLKEIEKVRADANI